MHPVPNRLAVTILLAALATTLPASAETYIEPTAAIDDQDAVSFRGLFDLQLPRLIRPESLRFTFNPSFGDFVHRDYVRIRTGFRYAFSKHCEVSAEVVPFFDNLGGKGEGGIGIAEYRFGTKFGWSTLLAPYLDTAFGATVARPVPGAPDALTIGTTRFIPYLVFSRDLPGLADFEGFLNIAYECFDSDPDRTRIARYRPAVDNLILTPGLILHRAPWHYSLSTPLRLTGIDDGDHDYLSVMPSISYQVPPRWLPFLSGRVVVGASYEAIFFGSDCEQRIVSRLRWDFDWLKAARSLGSGVIDTLPWRGEPRPKP